ncbi:MULTISPECIES: ABC transporter permease [Neoroseomonas]|uniref:ABC transporter permease n=2 Tax=Neoroseomonas TaxID=2870716 RepID=A0A9X9WCB0_9PROT|nr:MULTISPECIES: ABC transporter permease [Neoroseomonas]MBR0657970.1 ABC transporter permease [Neoroseomonas oryzicola]NKE18712.1 ABC transporter permease [Neoroseomonas oryzicola]NMJ43675.1 ABC transporter permease [Neoroseomonas marina]
MIAFLRFLLLTGRWFALLGVGVIALFLLAAVCAPLFFSWEEATRVNLGDALAAPSAALPLGADEMGRSMVARLVWGARVSLLVAGLSVGVALIAGLVIGGLCGFYENRLTFVTMRAMDAIISFPRILVAIMLITILGPGIVSLTLAIAISSVPVFARLFRGPVLSLKKRDYVVAARSLGAGDGRLLFRHVMPNLTALIVVQGSISLAEAVLIASGLSFLGLGPQPPVPEWGAMIAQSRSHLMSTPHVVLAPGIALFVFVLALNLVGDGLRDFSDPRASGTGGR